MPMFDYECNTCSHITTEIVSISETDKVIVCEKCGGTTKKLVPTSVGAKFNGRGFHVNDYPSRGRIRGGQIP